MTDIKAFKGFIYNQKKIKNLSDVACPPYDVISEKELTELYKMNNFNFVKLLLAKNVRKKNKRVLNRYANAKQTFARWLKEDILISDTKDAIYFYLQEFTFKGERKSRLGFISLMRLRDQKQSTVYPHESTRKEPKDDRYALLRSVRANLSPIFTLFSDDERRINMIFENYLMRQKPMLALRDKEGDVHKIWPLREPKLIKRLQDYIQGKSIVIADGHHRYEVACDFRNAMLRPKGNRRKFKTAAFNYIMTYFSDINSRGLTVLSIHRLLKKIPSNFLERLDEFFKIEKIKDQFQLRFLLAKAARYEHAFGLYVKGYFYLLRLKSEYIIDRLLEGDSKDYNRLDVVLLNKLIFKRLFSFNSADLVFIKDEEEAIAAVNKGTFAACFFLWPTKLEQIKTIALNNERMPPKSTYFYPKLLSGLLIHKF
ncbi:MAG: DUF1015 domain-containing protein [Candidatus Omnitrophica bacterium]|nr:DUF1015 domain-containing protein [Candidatus Omnitrophota bacterium]